MYREIIWDRLVKDRILGQRPIPSLMEVCYEVRLQKDKVCAMNITTIYATVSTAFSAKLSGFDSEKQNEKQTLVCEHCKKP